MKDDAGCMYIHAYSYTHTYTGWNSDQGGEKKTGLDEKDDETGMYVCMYLSIYVCMYVRYVCNVCM